MGRVEIAKTDTLDTERADGVIAATATERSLETAGIIELPGRLLLLSATGTTASSPLVPAY